MKRSGSMLSIILAATAFHISDADAETKTIKGTNFHHTVVWQGIEVGDVEGHLVGAYENKGVSVYEDGQEVELLIRGTLDQVKGIGPVDGYDIRMYSDGSTITLEYHGEAKMTPEGRVVSGTYTSCRGAGRFEGAKCQGTWTGGRKGKSLNVFDWEVKYTLP